VTFAIQGKGLSGARALMKARVRHGEVSSNKKQERQMQRPSEKKDVLGDIVRDK
jgi:hypothetical protein